MVRHRRVVLQRESSPAAGSTATEPPDAAAPGQRAAAAKKHAMKNSAGGERDGRLNPAEQWVIDCGFMGALDGFKHARWGESDADASRIRFSTDSGRNGG